MGGAAEESSEGVSEEVISGQAHEEETFQTVEGDSDNDFSVKVYQVDYLFLLLIVKSTSLQAQLYYQTIFVLLTVSPQSLFLIQSFSVSNFIIFKGVKGYILFLLIRYHVH